MRIHAALPYQASWLVKLLNGYQIRRTTELRYSGIERDIPEKDEGMAKGLTLSSWLTWGSFIGDAVLKSFGDKFRENKTKSGLQGSLSSQAVVKSMHFSW